LGQTEKSALAEHTLSDDNHIIHFSDTQILSTNTPYYARLHRESIEIHKHKNNFNKDDSYRLNKTWYPVLRDKIIQSTHDTSHAHERATQHINTAVNPQVGSFDNQPPHSDHLPIEGTSETEESNHATQKERGRGRYDLRALTRHTPIP
jgi:hypothetical protein